MLIKILALIRNTSQYRSLHINAIIMTGINGHRSASGNDRGSPAHVIDIHFKSTFTFEFFEPGTTDAFYSRHVEKIMYT